MNKCKFTLNHKDLIFNECRQKAYVSFKKTLNNLYGKDNITEKVFQKEWFKNLEQEENIIADGWYNPPKYGMAVLFGSRVSFDSLRNEDNWPKDIIMDWKNDMMYAYCSPVDKKTGIIGDMSITLYFGKDKRILDHINNCYGREVCKPFMPKTDKEGYTSFQLTKLAIIPQKSHTKIHKKCGFLHGFYQSIARLRSLPWSRLCSDCPSEGIHFTAALLG